MCTLPILKLISPSLICEEEDTVLYVLTVLTIFLQKIKTIHSFFRFYSNQMKSDFDENVAENTCPDFWKMVWKTNTKIIVMLCQVQPGFTGCSEYFPMKSGEKTRHGAYEITNEKSLVSTYPKENII